MDSFKEDITELRNFKSKHGLDEMVVHFYESNVRPLADVRDLNTALVNVVMSPAYWQAVVGRSYIMESILEKIDDERVFTMRLSDDKKKLNIEEACDRWFEIQLTKKEALKMLDEITHIVNQMSE